LCCSLGSASCLQYSWPAISFTTQLVCVLYRFFLLAMVIV
jgi:hypothetical protein